jgi:serine phosphatase RsbU (regulator of sigma subunit)
MPVPLVILLSIYSSFIAIGWAYSFSRNLKALPFVLIFQIGILFIQWQHIFPSSNNLNRHSKLLFDAIGIYVGVILGYIFFIIFISREGVKQIKLKTEIDLAAEMHEVLVPLIDFRNENLEVYGRSFPALEIGGDLIDLYKGDKHFTAFIGDVSGHGIDAGLLMGMFKSAIYSWLGNNDSLTSAIYKVNNTLNKLKKPNMFITCSMIRFFPDSSVEYLTAGHLPVLWFRKELNTVEYLLIKQIPITVKQNYNFLSQYVKYSKGDIFILLTDGIVEVMDKGGEQFELNRVERILIDNNSESAKLIFDHILEGINKFGKQKDDQSAIIIRCLT